MIGRVDLQVHRCVDDRINEIHHHKCVGYVQIDDNWSMALFKFLKTNCIMNNLINCYLYKSISILLQKKRH
jgi:hypothetical protein